MHKRCIIMQMFFRYACWGQSGKHKKLYIRTERVYDLVCASTRMHKHFFGKDVS